MCLESHRAKGPYNSSQRLWDGSASSNQTSALWWWEKGEKRTKWQEKKPLLKILLTQFSTSPGTATAWRVLAAGAMASSDRQGDYRASLLHMLTVTVSFVSSAFH